MPDNRKKPTLQEQVDQLMERFEEVNDFYITKVAEQIRAIGELTPSSMSRIAIMAQMNRDIAEINRKIAQAVQMAVPDVYKIYQRALDDLYYDPRFERALKETPLSDASKRRLEQFVRSVSRQTAGTMQNLSNTTIVSQTYRRTVDNAVLAVSTGLTDYRSATRESVRSLGYEGLQLTYPSGYHRRLDTAIRQNVLDGAKQIAQHGSDIMGEELGYDAVEISVHAMSAPDHEPIQGHVFLKEEFEKMQSGQSFVDVDGRRYDAIRRPIGQWNCMHFAMSFSTLHSVRKYTDAQLVALAEANASGCEINGRHLSLYRCSQTMRELETQVRREMEAANAAKTAGDTELRKDCQRRINALNRRYLDLCKASGLKPRRERMYVRGFKMVKV